jgi:osmotically-inducible protein OsmY
MEASMLKHLTLVAWAVGVIATSACGSGERSDSMITADVKSQFAMNDTVKAYQIDVDTQAGVVTLSGPVDSSAAKDEAVRLARATDGVTSVVDRMTLAPADTIGGRAGDAMDDVAATTGQAMSDAAGAASDATITAAVKTKLLADTTVSGLKIDVDTSGGVVTLNGAVRTAAERDRAMALARETDGVRSVNDKLTMQR